ncbi:MAG: SPFH domain-containing protein [Candidatus Paceibacterota bacterium]|jgi:hypothetical protein
MEAIWENMQSILTVIGYIIGGIVVIASISFVIFLGVKMAPILIDKNLKLSRVRTLFISGPILTIAGWPIFLVLIQVLFWMTNWIIGNSYLEHNTVTIVAGLFLSIAYFYIGGLAKVKKASVGMPEIFGARRVGFVLPEGYCHIPPRPFMSYTETPIELITTKLNEPMEVLVGKQISADPNQPQAGQVIPDNKLVSEVKMKVDASIAWQADPLNLLGYTSVQDGAKGVEKALVDIMRRVIREKAQGMSDSEFLKGQKDLEEALKAALEAPLNAEEEAKKASNGDWHNLIRRLGITVIKIQVTKIVPASEEMITRLERIRGEQLDQEAEKNQVRHLIDNLAGPLIKELNVSPEAGLRAALATTKDATMIIVDGAAGDFTKGQALAANSGNQRR